MLTERGSVVRALRSRGDHDRALEAECKLPKWVDLEQDLEASELEPAKGSTGT